MLINRFYANWNVDYSFKEQFGLTHLRIDSLFFGVLLSFAIQFRSDVVAKAMRYRTLAIALCAIFVLQNFFIWRGGMRSVLTLSMNVVGYGGLIFYCYQKQLLEFKPLSALGRYSYNIYLWHYPFFLYNEHLLSFLNVDTGTIEGYLCYIFTYMSLSILTGILFTKVVENPFLALREKLYPSILSKKKASSLVSS